jgi:hypothetical protein
MPNNASERSQRTTRPTAVRIDSTPQESASETMRKMAESDKRRSQGRTRRLPSKKAPTP